MTENERNKFVESILNEIDAGIILSYEDFDMLVNSNFEIDSTVIDSSNDGYMFLETIVKLGSRYFRLEYEKEVRDKINRIIGFNIPQEVTPIKTIKVVTEYIDVTKGHNHD